MKKLSRNLIEEDSSQCLKILSQYTVKKRKIDWQRFQMFCLRERKVFPKTINERILRQWQQTYLEKLLLPFAVFSFQGQTDERWKRLLERHSVRFPKYSSVTLKSLNGKIFLSSSCHMVRPFTYIQNVRSIVDTVILYPVIPFINVTEIRTLRSSSLNTHILGALLL